jgi:hypothetical protein
MSVFGNKIQINTHYTRSINLNRDSDSLSVVQTYIPTSRSIQTLEQMSEAFDAQETPRSWSLVGPYGSGKSAFAIFLANLLGNPKKETTRVAYKILKASNNKLAERFETIGNESSGYCTVLITGSPESFNKSLVRNLAKKISSIWDNPKDYKPEIVSRLNKISERIESPPVSEVLDCIKELQSELHKIGMNGILIVIDELGKFLEYEARHNKVNEIFLLQSLAEHAMQDNPTKLSLLVMLHQSFDYYAKGLGESLKNEWAKIQGRFENISFLESSEQILRIVAAAINQNFNDDEFKKIQNSTSKMTEIFARTNAFPGIINKDTASHLFKSCYPLHPVSSILLPILCQKVAQNERTLFSYLGSREKNGFQDSLSRCLKVSDWIYPWEIFDYFILNQPSALTDHFTHRRWAEVMTAIDRLGDAPVEEQQILKAIGLLNIIGAQGNFKASEDLLGLCFSNKSIATKTLTQLQNKSIIQFRKFSSEYRVWQGSDFDLDSRVEEELTKLGRFELAEQINKRHNLLPIVARRYTIENGTLRYFTPIFADSKSAIQLVKENDQPRIIFYLSEDKDEENYFNHVLAENSSKLNILVFYKDSNILRETIGESLALEALEQSSQELNEDAVAMREFKTRYANTLAEEEKLLSALIDRPESAKWYWKSAEPLIINRKRDFQEQLSKVLNEVYCDCPIIKNEIINRKKVSSQGFGATNKLAIAMAMNEIEDNLGFDKDKFPPEKSIYLSLLKESKLHTNENGKWSFKKPQEREDPCKFNKVWKRIDLFLKTTEQQAHSLVTLNKELIAPPFGVKEGILPILYFAVMLTYKHELAVFENRNYIASFTEEQVSRFLKRPDEFTVQQFRIEGLNQSIFEAYSEVIYNDKKQNSILSIARPIAKIIGDLPEYTLNTKLGLGDKEKKVRDSYKIVKSPEEFLLKGIPKALGLNLETDDKEEILALLSLKLKKVFRNLQNCHSTLLDEMRGLLALSLNLSKNEELSQIRKTASRFNGLEKYIVDKEGQGGFLIRINKEGISDDDWLENILMFLAQKQTNKWSDKDKDLAEIRLSELSRKLKEVEQLTFDYKNINKHSQDGEFDIYILRSFKKGAPDIQDYALVNPKIKKIIKRSKEKILEEIRTLDDPELQKALIAEITDEFLKNNKERVDQNKNQEIPPKIVTKTKFIDEKKIA